MKAVTKNEEGLLELLMNHDRLGDQKARQLLGMTEEAYRAASDGLVAQGFALKGRERGGSIQATRNGAKFYMTMLEDGSGGMASDH